MISDSSTCQVRPASREAIDEAASRLRKGELVAFPTETVYGLGADAGKDSAVAAIFAAKQRPRFNPLIVHFLGAESAGREVVFDERAEQLSQRFWPGALTLVLPRHRDCQISLLCSAGLPSLAVRAPSHPLAQELLARCALPLAAPSANAAGRISPTTAAHVAQSLGSQVPLILDGGACQIGLESTVVDLTGEAAALLRPGAVTQSQIEAAIGPLARPAQEDARKSPGMLASHYAPERPLRLRATEVSGDEALLAFGPRPLEGAALTLNLSAAGDVDEAAANLFAFLHRLDRPEFAAVAVMPVPEQGLGQAINDRLRRAAAPRGP